MINQTVFGRIPLRLQCSTSSAYIDGGGVKPEESFLRSEDLNGRGGIFRQVD